MKIMRAYAPAALIVRINVQWIFEMAKIYTVKRYVDYEGEYTAFEGTLREVRAWVNLKENRRDIDDLSLYSNDAPDIYSLLKPMEKRK